MDPDPAQLRGQRLRGGRDRAREGGQRARGRAHSRGRPGRRRPDQPQQARGVDEAALGRGGQGRVIGELSVGGSSRVLGSDAGKDQLLERPSDPGPPRSPGSATRPGVGCPGRPPSSERPPRRRAGRYRPTRHRAQSRAWRDREREALHLGVVATLDSHGAVAELMDKADRGDLGGSELAIPVLIDEPLSQTFGAGKVHDDGVAIGREGALFEAVALAGDSGDAEIHRGHDGGGRGHRCSPWSRGDG